MRFFQRLLKQDKERFTIPQSVQQSIPIKNIWAGRYISGGRQVLEVLAL